MAEKGVLVCVVDTNGEFDCSLDGKKLTVHTLIMKNGPFTQFGIRIPGSPSRIAYKQEAARLQAQKEAGLI